MPKFPASVGSRTRRTHDRQQYITTWHSSNLYSLKYSLVMGLVPGPAAKSSLHGLYMCASHDESDKAERSAARSSSGYRVYSSLGGKDYFWSVIHELAFGKFLTYSMGKMMAGNGPIAAKEGNYHVVRVWFHCLRMPEMLDCAQNGLTVSADFFHPDYEITH